MARFLVIDDDLLFCEALGSTLEEAGHAVIMAHSLARARELLKSQRVDVAFIDVYLPDGNGMDLLSGLPLLPAPPLPIVVTAQGNPDGAENAISSGAWDYVQKPADMAAILRTVNQALQHCEQVRTSLPDFFKVSHIIGNSQAIRHSLLQIFDAAQSEAPVLISGETGTGKELFARTMHANSKRSSGPFIVVDCGAIAPSLIESELFGHVRGAFTGAVRTRQGLVTQADGGTLFLDEVGELALDQQKIFLRLLQERTYRPIGGAEELQSDFRIVAATNRNLAEMAAGGTFRQDLLFRLKGLNIEIPPLRQRGEDVAALTQYALSRALKQYGIQEKSFSPDAMAALTAYTWPGNIRELLHAVENALLTASNAPVILLQHLPMHLRTHAVRSRVEENTAPTRYGARPAVHPAEPPSFSAVFDGAQGASVLEHAPYMAFAEERPGENAARAGDVGIPSYMEQPPFAQSPAGTWKEFQERELFEYKRRYLVDLLRRAGGSVPEAARMAGLSRQRLYTLLKEHGIARQWDA